jgi:hypothetical protein
MEFVGMSSAIPVLFYFDLAFENAKSPPSLHITIMLFDTPTASTIKNRSDPRLAAIE